MDAAPPRPLARRVQDTWAMLEREVDAWVATAGPAGPHLVPLSFLWDGTALLLATDRSTASARNLLADPRVRLALGATRDVVVVDGTAEPVDLAGLPPGTGDAFADRTGFDPRELGDGYVYLRVVPHRIQTWRSENETAGRDVMRAGTWLA